MSSKVDLRLDWCSHKAARYATQHWHYSRTLPMQPTVNIGVWEDGEFIGVVIFGRGAARNLLKPYGLDVTEGCELTRVALRGHKSPVSRLIRIAVNMLREQSPRLRLIISFADANQGHVGAIYQAGNWTYAGQTPPSRAYVDRSGRKLHQRQVSKTGTAVQFGKRTHVPMPSDCTVIALVGKHRYLMPLDDDMREQIAPLAQPYPKRPKDSSEPSGVLPGEGGAAPTRTLQITSEVNDAKCTRPRPKTKSKQDS